MTENKWKVYDTVAANAKRMEEDSDKEKPTGLKCLETLLEALELADKCLILLREDPYTMRPEYAQLSQLTHLITLQTLGAVANLRKTLEDTPIALMDDIIKGADMLDNKLKTMQEINKTSILFALERPKGEKNEEEEK